MNVGEVLPSIAGKEIRVVGRILLLIVAQADLVVHLAQPHMHSPGRRCLIYHLAYIANMSI